MNFYLNIRTIKNSPVCRMTSLAQELAKTKKQHHEKVEEFFLTNDSATVAVEVPVYLTKEESEFPKTLAGHIDIIQVRNNKVHILDYKPDREGNAVSQLLLYAKCLKKYGPDSVLTKGYREILERIDRDVTEEMTLEVHYASDCSRPLDISN